MNTYGHQSMTGLNCTLLTIDLECFFLSNYGHQRMLCFFFFFFFLNFFFFFGGVIIFFNQTAS